MANPIVSVVLPVYQGMPFLREAVESVLAQEGVSFELILGDDGSTDGSRAYLESLRDPRVRFFPGRERRGLFPHLNQLLDRVRGTFTRFFCQDDVLESGCLQRDVDFFVAHPEVPICVSKFRLVDVQGKVTNGGALDDLPPILSSSLAIQHFFYHGCIAGNLSTVCVRTPALLEEGRFDESFRVSGDYDMWSRFARRFPVGVLREPLVRIRNHPKQLSRVSQSAVAFVLENARIREGLLPYLPPGVQKAARRFERRRHHVLDWHQALRCLLAGRFRDAWVIFSTLGLFGCVRAFFAWAGTFNNRLRPQAPWVVTENS
jgi:glycosyltransferase involved in cell wall biosynthesis